MALLALVSTQSLIAKSISTFTLNISTITGGNSVNTEQLTSTIGGLGQIYTSTAGGGGGGDVTSANLVSTVKGLGTVGYLSTAGGGITSLPSTISTFSLLTSSIFASTATINIVSSLLVNASSINANVMTTSTVNANSLTLATNPSWILTSPIQTLAISTNTLWTDAAYINSNTVTTEVVSTLTTNALTLGTGATWIQTAPLQTSIISTVYAFASQPYLDTVNVGTTSTMNSMQFVGLFSNYNNTVMAEISTGAGAQEFLVFKGSSASDRVRVQTTGNFVIETGVSARLWNSNTTQTLSNATPAFIVNTSSNVGIQTASPGATLDVAGTGRFQLISTLGLNISTINGQVYSAGLTTANLTSTVGGLGQIYLSTAGGGGIATIPANLSTSAFFTSSIVASTMTLSSLQVNILQIGSGTGWVNLGPIEATAVSSIQENTNALYAANAYIGITSTMNALSYNGLFGNYNNTVLAEISTGAGTQEFLVFKGSSASDRVRVQTTGNFVIETGVSARLFNSNTTQTLSNATPAFIVNSSSNVGIQTAAPGATLDVAGTGRFLTLSSLALYTSSIVAPYVFQPQFFTF